jgi:hypothetical protein
VSGQDSQAEIFDVFLCHNSEDKPAVREIAQQLIKEGIKPWLDAEQIPPGSSWQTELGEQIKCIKSAAVFVGNSGIGPWQNEEIQAFLSQFIERKCPVIPTILGSAATTPELPWTLKNRHHVDFRVSDPDPLKQLIWGITRQRPTAREKLIPRRDELAASKRTSIEPRLYRPLTHPPDQDQIGQLEIFRRRVNEYWIDGVLKHSLHNEVLISLGKREIGDAVDAPWKYSVEVSDFVNSASLEDRDVSTIYDTVGLLLILGEPGSGKTTTLLDLARTLLERAGENIKERVPVVLNLSSWKKKQPLSEWISGELSEKYRVPRKIAHSWLQNGYLLPLLDGLDEVPTPLQPDCVAAINVFVEESDPSGLVVCCRLNEYRWLPERLKLNGAICVEPLSKDEVDKYFAAAGPELTALRNTVNADPVLQELTQTPLMLSVMSLAYQGARRGELAEQEGDSTEKRRMQVFRLYVEQMFKRKGTSLVFPKEKTIEWLSWLAANMREHSRSVFLVEGIQPSWLGTKGRGVAYRATAALGLAVIAGLIFGLTVGSIYALSVNLHYGLTNGLVAALMLGLITSIGVGLGCSSESRLKNGIAGGLIGVVSVALLGALDRASLASCMLSSLIAGLIVGLINGLGTSSLNQITLVEALSWRWGKFLKSTGRGALVGLIVGLIFGLMTPLIIPHGALSTVPGSVLRFGLIFGLGTGLIAGFADRVKVGKVNANQGIKLSQQNSINVFLVTCVSIGLISGLTSAFGGRPIDSLILGLVLGLPVGLIAGLNRGGSAVVKHYALRTTFWLNRNAPLNLIKFLDDCAKLILLKKVGGGYIFIHRMLLEYFADLPAIERSGESKRG